MTSVDELARSQGYSVNTHDGRIGSVAAVLPRAGGKPGFLLVQTGLLSCRITSVPFGEIEEVDQSTRRVVLRETPATLEEARPSAARNGIAARA
jgi:hypothetical protein